MYFYELHGRKAENEQNVRLLSGDRNDADTKATGAR